MFTVLMIGGDEIVRKEVETEEPTLNPEVSKMLSEFQEAFNELQKGLDNLERIMDKGFIQAHVRFNRLDAKFDDIPERLNDLAVKFSWN